MHGDNGSTLKATTVLATLYWLGVKPSYSRPRVSDDNAYAEPLFRTAKYCPEFPGKGIRRPTDGTHLGSRIRALVQPLEHRHSGIRYVTPAQRHSGQDVVIQAARHELYRKTRERHPARWSGAARDWSPMRPVTLKPERDSVVKGQAQAQANGNKAQAA